MRRQFLYCLDPLFLVALSLALAWRTGLWPTTPFLASYGNDLLVASLCVPPMLWGIRLLGLRPDDAAPHAHEIVIPLIVVTVMFEIVFPITGLPGVRPVADHRDVVAYFAGGALAAAWWRWWYRPVSNGPREQDRVPV